MHAPAVCGGYGSDLANGELVGEEARQVFDLPPVRLLVSEHRCQRRRCGCGHVTAPRRSRPVSARRHSMGPGVRALAIYLIVVQHLPYQRAATLLGDWSTEMLTFYALHDRRGTEGIDHAGVMPNFQGIAVHDGWPQYRAYTEATHALCNAHHLRELLAVIEQQTDGQRSWATHMDALLRALHEEVKAAKAVSEDWPDPWVLAGYPGCAYQQIIAAGNDRCPLSTIKTGKRGVIRQSPARNLFTRLDRDREQILRFAHDFQVPFDNNLVERDIRMIKIQQKISGSWRTTAGADHFLALRSYISTARKQGRDILDTLARLANHRPWLRSGHQH